MLIVLMLLVTLGIAHADPTKTPTELHRDMLYQEALSIQAEKVEGEDRDAVFREMLSIQAEKMRCYGKQAALAARVMELEAKLDKVDPHWRER